MEPLAGEQPYVFILSKFSNKKSPFGAVQFTFTHPLPIGSGARRKVTVKREGTSIGMDSIVGKARQQGKSKSLRWHSR